jgi:hypothetical protein
VDWGVGVAHRARCRGARFDDDAVEFGRFVFVVVEKVMTDLNAISGGKEIRDSGLQNVLLLRVQ